MRRLPTTPQAPGLPRHISVSIPTQRHGAVIPRGPQLYNQPIQRVDFPGDPPPAFLDPTLHGSRSEWPIYAALWKYFNTQPRDGYRRPPFLGEPGVWNYQSWQLGGRTVSFGAVADFEILSGRRGESMLLRIQSDRFHLTAPNEVRSFDDLQRERLSENHIVVDLFERDFLHLRGGDLVAYLANVLSGQQILNPLTAGTYQRSQ